MLVLKNSVYRNVRRSFGLFVLLTVAGVLWNGVGQEPGAVGMLMIVLGWSGLTTTAALLLTRKTVCPRCQKKTIPTGVVLDTPCQFCSSQ